jgi:outer membrane receptor protein involved in Fe transport
MDQANEAFEIEYQRGLILVPPILNSMTTTSVGKRFADQSPLDAYSRFLQPCWRFHRIALVFALGFGCTSAWCHSGAPGTSSVTKPVTSTDSEAAKPLDASSVEEIIILGRNSNLVGLAEAASEGSVAGADLLVRPMLRVAEVLEVVPGMVAVQHSGSGKANQYFLRGFNLDHGTDFSLYVDGVPGNLRSHGHGQGYLDVNGLMPETIERIDYRKGPYRGDVGDFSMAGSSFITTIDRLDSSFVSLESGQNGWGRIAAGDSRDLDAGELTIMGEYKSYDGPWQLPEDLRHFAMWAKYLQPTAFGSLAISLSGYEGHWRPTEQIPERVIGSSVCANAFCTLDLTPVGKTTRWIAALQLIGSSWTSSAYLQTYDWHMQSNPTYDFQINQFDRRWTTGGRYQRTLFESAAEFLNIGAEARYDDIGPVGLDQYQSGHFEDKISDNDIKESSVTLYAEAGWSPNEHLRLLAALRADYYSFDVGANTTASFAGKRSDSRVSPKLGAAYALMDKVELYANWGRGFHSNDARGVVNADHPVPGLATGKGYEVGTRLEISDLKMTAAYWWLGLDSELIFVGDSNSVEPKGSSAREGYELTLFWRPKKWLAIDAVLTGSKARYVDNPEGQYVENSVEQAGQAGISVVKRPWEVSVRARYLGPYALTADNVRRASAETTVSLRAAYSWPQLTVYAELYNALDANGKDVVYYYPAYVAGFDPPGLTSDDIDCEVVNCRMSRAQEPRTIRLGIKYQF